MEKVEEIIKNRGLSIRTFRRIQNILEREKAIDCISVAKELNLTSSTVTNYLAILERVSDNIESFGTRRFKIRFIKGCDDVLLQKYFSTLALLGNSKLVMETLRGVVNASNLEKILKLFLEKKAISLNDIQRELNCTKSLASYYLIALEKIKSDTRTINFLNNKKVVYTDKDAVFKRFSSESFRSFFDMKSFLKNLRLSLNLTGKQFATLLGINVNSYYHYENDIAISQDILQRIVKVLEKINKFGLRRCLFEANKRIKLDDKRLTLKLLRRRVNASLRELAKVIEYNDANIQKIESGNLSLGRYRNEQIIEGLKTLAEKRNINFEKTLEEVKAIVRTKQAKEFKIFDRASKYEKIIDLKSSAGFGKDFEGKIANFINSLGFDDVFRNVVLSTSDFRYTTEADIYAIKNISKINSNKLNYDLIAECKSRRDRNSRGTKGLIGFGRELEATKRILDIDEAVLVVDIEVSNFVRKRLKNLNIMLIDKRDLEKMVENGIQHMDRNLSSQDFESSDKSEARS